jgi:hypothetical protein
VAEARNAACGDARPMGPTIKPRAGLLGHEQHLQREVKGEGSSG